MFSVGPLKKRVVDCLRGKVDVTDRCVLHDLHEEVFNWLYLVTSLFGTSSVRR